MRPIFMTLSSTLTGPAKAGHYVRLGIWSVEATDVGGFADDVAFHGFHQVIARRVARQIEHGVERVELKQVVMERARASTGTEIRSRISTARVDPGTVLGAIRQ